MKNLIITFLAMAMSAFAQVQYINVGTNTDDHTGELIGHNTWLKLNYNFSYLSTSESNLNAIIATSTNIAPNIVYSGGLTSLYSSNPFVFSGGSNYIGQFTNIFSFTAASTTNLTNIMSIAGGAWQSFAVTNPFVGVLATNIFTNWLVYTYTTTTNIGTNTYNLSWLGTNFVTSTNVFTNYFPSGIRLSVLSSGTTTGSVAVAALQHQELNGRYNRFSGQTFDFSGATVQGLNLGMTTNLQFTFSSQRTNTLYFTNGLLIQVTSP